MALDDETWNSMWAQRGLLVAMARRRVKSEDDAVDIVHEAMARAASAEGLDSRTIGAWLNRVVRNLCVDYLREAGYGKHRVLYQQSLQMAEHPVDVVCARDMAHRLGRAMNTLPERQRAAVVLHITGLSVREIADRVGCTVKGAERLLEKGRARLHKIVPAVLIGAFLPKRTVSSQRLALTAGAMPLVVAAVICGPILTMPNGDGPTPPPSYADLSPRFEPVWRDSALVARARAARNLSTMKRPLAGGAPSSQHVVVPQRQVNVHNSQAQTPKVTHSGSPSDLPSELKACLSEGIEVSPGYVGCRAAPH